ncbi:MAG: 4Fe-4S binding protein, partial [Deltaproteobacteria bacterium]|nr:4Fe-4S binding protein [Deltaproteobacteria bacterium]
MAIDYKALKNGGFMRQKQKDNFSLRLKVVGGNMTTAQLKTVIDVADAYGGGYVHFTSRQGLEIPFIKLADVEAVKTSLKEGGVDTGVCGPRVRTVTACQGSDICPSGCIETTSLAGGISERYFGRQLPHKFKFGITGCQNNCLKAEENDLGVKGGLAVTWLKDSCTLCGVCLKACREKALTLTEDEIILDAQKCNHCGRCAKVCPSDAWRAQPCYLISFGGLFGNRIATGRQLKRAVTTVEEIYSLSDAALDFFDAYGKPSERFRLTIERAGWEAFSRKVG